MADSVETSSPLFRRRHLESGIDGPGVAAGSRWRSPFRGRATIDAGAVDVAAAARRIRSLVDTDRRRMHVRPIPQLSGPSLRAAEGGRAASFTRRHAPCVNDADHGGIHLHRLVSLVRRLERHYGFYHCSTTSLGVVACGFACSLQNNTDRNQSCDGAAQYPERRAHAFGLLSAVGVVVGVFGRRGGSGARRSRRRGGLSGCVRGGRGRRHRGDDQKRCDESLYDEGMSATRAYMPNLRSGVR